MARPLRLEFAGALYHVTSCVARREAIYSDDDDRREWLAVLALVCERFNWVVHGYCQMTNHYHFLGETVEANLSQGMRQLNGLYTQRFNRRHGMGGHLFQGRYKAILVQKEAHLLELARYVVLNPVRAGMVSLPEEWAWSSFNVYLHAALAHVAKRWYLLVQYALGWNKIPLGTAAAGGLVQHGLSSAAPARLALAIVGREINAIR